MTYSFRLATIDDLSQLVSLEQLCFTDPWPAHFFAKQLQNPQARYFVGHYPATPSQILAYAGYRYIHPEGEILNIATAPIARRQGWARSLMRHLLHDAQQYNLAILFLEVRQDNLSAQHLYEGFGFSQIGTRKHYYGTNQHAFLYSLDMQNIKLSEK